MKESITKFDLEAAFKALDEIDIPVAEKVKANRPALNEIFSKKTKLESLMEEYYDVGSMNELGDAKEAREAEIAKAKLARIEKIVDLDAESPEDLLTSYVGKYIIQCPQCMTLFYKNQEDVVESEDDPSTVNVSEVCQHCGNEAGYTLIGKVGEATPEDNFEETEATEEELPVEETSEEEATEESEETSEETTDESEELKDLEALDLNLEDEDLDTEEEKTEESFTAHEGETLVEELTEAADLEVSADEFEELINSPEFKKPISDTAVRAMLDTEKDEEKPVEESVEVEETEEPLEEGIFDKLKSLFTTRASTADWVLKNALVDYSKATAAEDGNVETQADNKKFNTFLVIGFKDTGKNKQKITGPVKPESSNIVVGMESPTVASKYADAEKIAKGWSMVDGNGPAFIYLAKNKDADDAAFLCQYFKGELDKTSDQLKKYAEKVKSSILGSKLISKGKANQAESEISELPASKIKPGMKVQSEDKTFAEVTEVKQSRFNSKEYSIAIKYEDGTPDYLSKTAKDSLLVLQSSITNESFDNVMAGLEELEETVLETLISDSLVEAYGNVAGFRLAECGYADEKFTVDGTIHFSSGKTRKTTYTFSEAYINEGKISMHGLNEKLGLDKQFTLTGHADENKTFITESFTYTKK